MNVDPRMFLVERGTAFNAREVLSPTLHLNDIVNVEEGQETWVPRTMTLTSLKQNEVCLALEGSPRVAVCYEGSLGGMVDALRDVEKNIVYARDDTSKTGYSLVYVSDKKIPYVKEDCFFFSAGPSRSKVLARHVTPGTPIKRLMVWLRELVDYLGMEKGWERLVEKLRRDGTTYTTSYLFSKSFCMASFALGEQCVLSVRPDDMFMVDPSLYQSNNRITPEMNLRFLNLFTAFSCFDWNPQTKGTIVSGGLLLNSDVLPEGMDVAKRTAFLSRLNVEPLHTSLKKYLGMTETLPRLPWKAWVESIGGSTAASFSRHIGKGHISAEGAVESKYKYLDLFLWSKSPEEALVLRSPHHPLVKELSRRESAELGSILATLRYLVSTAWISRFAYSGSLMDFTTKAPMTVRQSIQTVKGVSEYLSLHVVPALVAEGEL